MVGNVKVVGRRCTENALVVRHRGRIFSRKTAQDAAGPQEEHRRSYLPTVVFFPAEEEGISSLGSASDVQALFPALDGVTTLAGAQRACSTQKQEFDCVSTPVAVIVVMGVRTGVFHPSYLKTPGYKVQVVETIKYVIDVLQKRILHFFVHYTPQWLLYFFSLLDTPRAAGRICRIMRLHCHHVWSFNRLQSDKDCVSRLESLPLFNNGSYVDGDSRACRFLHSVLVEENAMHCEHLSFQPMADRNGKVKCQAPGQGFPFAYGFSPVELQMAKEYTQTAFRDEELSASAHTDNDLLAWSSLAAPPATGRSNQTSENHKQSSLLASNLGFRLLPLVPRPRPMIDDDVFANCSASPFQRVWIDSSDWKLHSSQHAIRLSRGSWSLDPESYDPTRVFFIRQSEESDSEGQCGAAVRHHFFYNFSPVFLRVPVAGLTGGGLGLHLGCVRRGQASAPERTETIVFLHGYPHHRHVWKRVSALLIGKHGNKERGRRGEGQTAGAVPEERGRTSYQIIALDFPGTGGSGRVKLPGGMRVDHVAKMFLQVLERLVGSAGGGITLVGHDWGGSVVWAIGHILAAPVASSDQHADFMDHDHGLIKHDPRWSLVASRVRRLIVLNGAHPARLASLGKSMAKQRVQIATAPAQALAFGLHFRF